MRLFLLLTAVFITVSPFALADSNADVPYTLQVGAFPGTDLADKFVVRLVQAGEHPACATVELQGRGYWTRVFVGLFSTSAAARRYGENLIARGIVDEFLVRRADLDQGVTRPRRVTEDATGGAVVAKSFNSFVPKGASLPARNELYTSHQPSIGVSSPAGNVRNLAVKAASLEALPDKQASAIRPLADFRAAALKLAPSVDTGLIPRPDAVTLALRLVVGELRGRPSASEGRGGLWLTGDTADGLDRLRWVVGSENAALIKLDEDGRVRLDRSLLAKAAGLDRSRVGDPLQVAAYISSNEGLLLMVQLSEGRYRYRIHAGRQVPTRGKTVEITGSINLDRNFDSRINTYRKDGKKLDSEQPPQGFDSLIGLNPVARWFNLSTNDWVQAGEILFHEMAEAYAKLELNLDYLDHGSETGAHALALDRERRLKSQRPDANIVLTAGSNRVLRTQEEIRLFYAEGVTGASQR